MAQNGLANSGAPLGGLGTGSVELRSDGYFHEWQLMNNRPWGSGPEVDLPLDTAFFGLHVKAEYDEDAHETTHVLGLAADYSSSKASLLGHYLTDPYHLPWLNPAAAIDSAVQFPFTSLRYDLPDCLVQVELEAFSPFIPLDEKNSALPAACFTFHLKNITDRVVEVSLFAALRNLVGYAQPEQPSSMQFMSGPDADALTFGRLGTDEGSPDNGSLVLSVLTDDQGETTYLCHPRSVRDLWDPFHTTGRMENRDVGDFSGLVGNEGAAWQARLRQGLPLGALCQTLTVPVFETRTVTFILAWHFPNFYEAAYPEKNRPAALIGHRYGDWFDDAGQVMRYFIDHLVELRDRSRAFVDAWYQSSFPRWLLDAVAAQLTTLVKSSWWDRQGRFGIWEGLGCCGLQTTDITYYGSFPIVLFFPEIQKSQMRLTRDNVEIPGKIPHCMPGTFACGDVDHRGRIDLIPQYILLVWRDVLWTGDLAYAREMWPSIKDALFFFASTDLDGDGLPNNTGPDQTYDQFPLKGTSAFVGFLYAGSLQAAAQLADLLGEPVNAAQYRQELQLALTKLNQQLWTGEYYRLCFDPLTGQANDGVMTDQINGDWFIRQTGGGGLLPDRKVRAALRSIFEFCSRPQGYVANCAWPFGGAIEIGRHTSDQANSPWSGVEFAFAAHLILCGMEKEGLKVTKDVWDRYERAGLRFNHIECGANYYRSLSSWAVYLALTGFAWDAVENSLTLAIHRRTKQLLFNTPACWGVMKMVDERGGVQLNIAEGTLVLSRLTLQGSSLSAARIMLNGVVVGGQVTKTPAGVQFTFDALITLQPGMTLTIAPSR